MKNISKISISRKSLKKRFILFLVCIIFVSVISDISLVSHVDHHHDLVVDGCLTCIKIKSTQNLIKYFIFLANIFVLFLLGLFIIFKMLDSFFSNIHLFTLVSLKVRMNN